MFYSFAAVEMYIYVLYILIYCSMLWIGPSSKCLFIWKVQTCFHFLMTDKTNWGRFRPLPLHMTSISACAVPVLCLSHQLFLARMRFSSDLTVSFCKMHRKSVLLPANRIKACTLWSSDAPGLSWQETPASRWPVRSDSLFPEYPVHCGWAHYARCKCVRELERLFFPRWALWSMPGNGEIMK